MLKGGIMNKKLLGVGIVIITLIVGGTTYLLMRNPDETKTTSQKSPAQTAEIAAENEGQYIDYEEVLPTTQDTKLLFFYAPWCPQCRAIEADINAKGVPNDVIIVKVDYDAHQDLRQKYGVTIQTTFVKVDEAGNLIDKFVAYDDPNLESVKRNLLQ